MLSITEEAKEKLEEIVDNRKDDEKLVRITYTPAMAKKFHMVWDQEYEGDIAIKGSDGSKIAIIGPEVAKNIDEFVVDYHETSEGTGFTVAKGSPKQSGVSS
jgi:Fe-S cluster assembly iron-binding protein IscA